MNILKIAILSVTIGVGASLAMPVPVQAATCKFLVTGVKGKHNGIILKVARAAKMKTACKRASRRCSRALDRARRNGKAGNRTSQCRRSFL